jgi:hypothetical protein
VLLPTVQCRLYPVRDIVIVTTEMHVLSIRVQEQDNAPIQCQVTVVATLFAKLTNLDVVTVVLFKSTLQQVSISFC